MAVFEHGGDRKAAHIRERVQVDAGRTRADGRRVRPLTTRFAHAGLRTRAAQRPWRTRTCAACGSVSGRLLAMQRPRPRCCSGRRCRTFRGHGIACVSGVFTAPSVRTSLDSTHLTWRRAEHVGRRLASTAAPSSPSALVCKLHRVRADATSVGDARCTCRARCPPDRSYLSVWRREQRASAGPSVRSPASLIWLLYRLAADPRADRHVERARSGAAREREMVL